MAHSPNLASNVKKDRAKKDAISRVQNSLHLCVEAMNECKDLHLDVQFSINMVASEANFGVDPTTEFKLTQFKVLEDLTP